MKIAICICTYRRPAMLDDLLASIERLATDGNELRLVVVDNDPTSSARAVVERHLSLVVTYDVHPARSISAVRNRSVERALALDCDIVAFLDDDQRVDPLWLRELLCTFDRFCAGAVAGAVVPVLCDTAPRWIRTGGFFDRPRYATGARVRPSPLGGVAIDANKLAAIPEPFGRHFGRPGGEDTYFLAQVSSVVGEPFWCDEAVLYETVPLERTTARWLLQRALHFGRAYSEYLRVQQSSRRQLARRAAACLIRILQGLALLPLMSLGGRARMVRAAAYACAGLGGLMGLGTAVG